MNEQTFLNAILDDPDVNDNYLVFADWLEEQGLTARARLIRTQIEVEEFSRKHPRRWELLERAKELQSECEASWPGYRRWKDHFSFEWVKGLPSSAYPRSDGADLGQIPFETLPDFPYLTTLRRLSSPPSADVLTRLHSRTNFHTLEIGGWGGFSDDDLEPLRQVKFIRGLDLSSEGLTDAGLEHFLHLKSLRSLDLSYTRLSAAGVARLTAFRKLRRLRLDRVDVGDAELVGLAKLRDLRCLSLNRTELTDAGLKRLARLKDQLVELDVGWTKVTAKSLDTILSFTKLRSLGIAKMDGLDDGNVMRLAALPELRKLDVGRTQVSHYRLHRLRQFPKLTYVHLEDRCDEYHEREVSAFLEEINTENFFVELDHE
jgi:uncharacterized protein (TIGR02996 family)